MYIYFPEKIQRKMFCRNRNSSRALKGKPSQLSIPLQSESHELLALQEASKHWSFLESDWAAEDAWVHWENIDWPPNIFFFLGVYYYSTGYLLRSADFYVLFSVVPMYSLSYSLLPENLKKSFYLAIWSSGVGSSVESVKVGLCIYPFLSKLLFWVVKLLKFSESKKMGGTDDVVMGAPVLM